MSASASGTSTKNAISSPPNGKRRTLVFAVLALFACAGIAYGLWWHSYGQFSEYTDDAYVGGNVVQITPQVAGAVLSIAADDTDFVKAGQTLVELDKTESRVALDGAEAQLAQTVRRVRNLMATTAALDAGVAQRRAELAKAQEDLARRERVTQSGAVSEEEIQHARDSMASARAALEASQQALAAHRTLIDRTTVDNHPDVLVAAARVRDVFLSFSRTSLPAPVSGFVAKRNVQVGQRVAPGASLMTVVPLEQVWVDANFKERQLAYLRVGQPVKLTADLYGSEVEYRGKVAGFSAGTGSAFALLPPQNASGNWIKIVQRVPVRILLDAEEVRKHPLRIGLSVQATVDVKDTSGPTIATEVRHAPIPSKPVDDVGPDVEAMIAETIAANSGDGTKP